MNEVRSLNFALSGETLASMWIKKRMMNSGERLTDRQTDRVCNRVIELSLL